MPDTRATSPASTKASASHGARSNRSVATTRSCARSPTRSEHRHPPHSKETTSMPNGLIQDDSLRVHPEGFALSLTMPWYRSLWLSSVGTLKVTIDGTEV